MLDSNPADQRPDFDPITGTTTTGHVWDGIRELNTPLPRWWLWLFYATILWSVGYWIVYPSWPLLSSYTTGAFHWQSRNAVLSDLEGLKAQRGPLADKLAAASLQEIASDPLLNDFARAQGRPAFAENCAPCHGAGGGGGRGYPNLNDDEWIWGGSLEEIAQTIRHGIRSADADARQGAAMPITSARSLAFPSGLTPILQPVRRCSPTIARSVTAMRARANASLGHPI